MFFMDLGDVFLMEFDEIYITMTDPDRYLIFFNTTHFPHKWEIFEPKIS